MKCAYTGIDINDPADGVWDDGEWISWEYINQHLDGDDNWKEDFDNSFSEPNPSTLELWELLGELVESSKNYLEVTGRHLPIYGELGELYGEIKYGIKRHKPNTPGSDGRMGKDFVEIKTISPIKNNEKVAVKRSGNFNKLLIVKINDDFESKMIDRKNLRKGVGKYAKTSWGNDNSPNK